MKKINKNVSENFELNINDSFDVNRLGNNLDKLNEKTKDLLKDAIISMFKKGFNVLDKKMYDGIKKLFLKLNIFKLCDFEDIDKGLATYVGFSKYKFSMQLDLFDNRVKLFAPMEGFFSTEFGYIKEGDFYGIKSHFSVDFGYDNNKFEFDNELIKEDLKKYRDKIKQILPLPIDDNKKPLNEEIGINLNKESLETNEDDNRDNVRKENKKEKEEISEIKEYTVKSGDTLWVIVKKNYGLKLNRDIANVINKIVKYNIENGNAGKLAIDTNGDRIKGDKIYPNQKILLPKEVIFRKKIFNRKK